MGWVVELVGLCREDCDGDGRTGWMLKRAVIH